MKVLESRGRTPHGGNKEVVHFLNDKDEPVDRSIATRVKIVELDGDEVVHTVWGTLERDLVE